MRIYKCPICGKEYNSAGAMAICVANCAEKEDKNSRLSEADSDVTLALESLEAAIDEYNSISTEFDYMVTLSKKAKGGTAKFETAFPEMAKKASTLDLESLLKNTCKIDDPKPKVKRIISVEEVKLNKEAEKCFDEVDKAVRSTIKNPDNLKAYTKDFNELKNLWNKASFEEKKNLISFLKEETQSLSAAATIAKIFRGIN